MLDFKTLLAINFLVNSINLATMTLLWRRYRGEFDGLSCWMAHMASHVLGVGLILMRDALPPLAVTVLANVLLMSSPLWLLMGFQRFTGRPRPQRGNLAALAVYALLLWQFSAPEDLRTRNILGALCIVWLDAQICWLTLRRVEPAMRRICLAPGLVCLGYVLASLFRAVTLGLPLPQLAAFRTGLADVLAVACYLSLHIMLMVSLTTLLARRLLENVRDREQQFAIAFQGAPHAMLIVRRLDDRILEVNRGFTEIFGHQREEALSRTPAELGLRLDAPPDSGGGRRELRLRRKSGEMMIGQVESGHIQINGQACLLHSIGDVTEESRLREQLRDLATRDSLTGLPNRRLFQEHLDHALARAARHGTALAVLAMDLDKFKAVNDQLGHAAGDAVLVEAARRLTAALRAEDVVSRFGGDEFVILLPEVADRADAGRVADKLVQALGAPFVTHGRETPILASFGVALHPEHGQDLPTLLRRADEALYVAKRQGGRGWRLADEFSPSESPAPAAP